MSDRQSKTFKKAPQVDSLSSSTLIQRVKSFKSDQSDTRRRSDSIASIEELVQCPICFEKFSQPRMLPCQHTFCLSCVRDFVLTLLSKHPKAPNDSCKKVCFYCPSCQTETVLENGVDSLDRLPTNVYITSLLRLLDTSEPSTPLTPSFNDVRCIKCETVCQFEAINCQHCKQMFCQICWGRHVKELEEKILTLSTHLEDSVTRLNHKVDEAEGRCNQLNEAIRQASAEQIERIRRKEEFLLQEVREFKLEEQQSSAELQRNIADLQKTIHNAKLQYMDDHNKVSVFMNLHRSTSKLLDDISHWGETRKIFDSDTFKLEEDNEGLNSEVEESQVNRNGMRIAINPLENKDTLVAYYKSKSFTPKMQWNKILRPGGVAVPPWSNNIYIATTDMKIILILNPQKSKIIGKIHSQEMLCPHGITFSKSRKEIYVTDKWKHCIHVFSSFGDYLRSLCSKGNKEGNVRSPEGIAITTDNKLVVCDTGNDRVLILDAVTGAQTCSIGWLGLRTVLNMPTSVAVTENNKIVVADAGNHRIKVFNIDGDKLLELGSIGRTKGQFRSAEIVAVDPLGFILVGDAGNSRIQIFDPTGNLVRVFGGAGSGPGQFKWISGIAVTPQLDIIVTDHKSRSMQIF